MMKKAIRFLVVGLLACVFIYFLPGF